MLWKPTGPEWVTLPALVGLALRDVVNLWGEAKLAPDLVEVVDGLHRLLYVPNQTLSTDAQAQF